MPGTLTTSSKSPTTKVPSKGDHTSLMNYYLDADGLLWNPLPRLLKGAHDLETIANAPKITHHYMGALAMWNTFGAEAMKFYESKEMTEELKRCAHTPVYMDPKITELNSEAMIEEILQNGAEISLSGRLFWNLLAVVSHSVATLSSSEHGSSQNQGFLPNKVTFGDYWIIQKQYRVPHQQPEVVLKVPLGRDDDVRLVGDLKFCLPVDFKHMIATIKQKERGLNKFRGVLGQVVEFMAGHKLQFAFLSNYNETVFIRLGPRDGPDGEEPCIYFSDIVKFDDETPNDTKTPSVRIGLMFITWMTCSPRSSNWKLEDKIYRKMKEKIWTSTTAGKPILDPFLLTPYQAHNDPGASSKSRSQYGGLEKPQAPKPPRIIPFNGLAPAAMSPNADDGDCNMGGNRHFDISPSVKAAVPRRGGGRHGAF